MLRALSLQGTWSEAAPEFSLRFLGKGKHSIGSDGQLLSKAARCRHRISHFMLATVYVLGLRWAPGFLFWCLWAMAIYFPEKFLLLPRGNQILHFLGLDYHFLCDIVFQFYVWRRTKNRIFIKGRWLGRHIIWRSDINNNFCYSSKDF